jgi:Holliday junction resolvase RusA-like endonuclease
MSPRIRVPAKLPASQVRALKRKAVGELPPADESYVLTITLPEPPSANRWWRRAGTHMHLSTAAAEYKAEVQRLVSDVATHRFVDGPLAVIIVWHRGRKAGDLDKRVGILLDAMQSVVYTNDAQITELHCFRREDKARPRVNVVVSFATPESR